MTLHELVTLHSQRPQNSVPDWMLGFFKRYSISFANGMTDLKTHVCWLQSRNFTIDLRLPQQSEQVAAKSLANYTEQELQQLANYEGWTATSEWDGTMLSWQPTDVSLQLHNRWTEPAILKRIGNCMVEFCQSDAYVEDWRLQPSSPGALIGLHLLEERELASGKVRHKGGSLIICGDYAGLVLGRADDMPNSSPQIQLKTLVANAHNDADALHKLFNFETSVAHGSLTDGFRVKLSTQASRIGAPLLPLDGFEYLTDKTVHGDHQPLIRQQLNIDGKPCERVFSIDTLEPYMEYTQATQTTPEAEKWLEDESPTLARYTKELY